MIREGRTEARAAEARTESEAKAEKTSIEVVFILDRSGSMGGLEQDTIGGFNAMLERQKRENADADIIWSTILFDDRVEVIHDRMPIEQVKQLTEKQYYVRGCTALLDAVGGAIDKTVRVQRNTKEEYVPKKTLFVITTDGLENSSMEYSYRRVRKMITHEQEKYGWEFMFLGANIDAAAEAGRIGIREQFTSNYINDGEGVAMNFRGIGSAISKMACCEALDGSELDEVRRDFAKRRK